MTTDTKTKRTEARTLPIRMLEGAAWNTHRPAGADDDGGIAGLAASLRASGMLHRVVVRRVEDVPGRTTREGKAYAGCFHYEIIDGHRRVEAARALGWKEVPCEIAEGLTEAEAQAMTLAANVQRLENDPLLESELIGRLNGEGRKTFAQIAAILGKGERYVARRARLCNLTEEWRKVFGLLGSDAATMECVAAHEKTLQEDVFREEIGNEALADGLEGWTRADIDVEVEGWFRERMRRIDENVPFDTAPCATCPNNTANYGWLFPPEQDGEVKGRCQDAACYARRWNEAVDAEIAALRRRRVKVFEAKARWTIPNGYSSTPHKERKNTQPWVYEDDGLKHLVWVEPSETAKAEAKTEAEKAAEKAFKARVKAWNDRRDAVVSAFASAGRDLLGKVAEAAPEKALAEVGLRCITEPTWWGADAARRYIETVGREAVKRVLPITDDQIDALSEARPTEDGAETDETTND